MTKKNRFWITALCTVLIIVMMTPMYPAVEAEYEPGETVTVITTNAEITPFSENAVTVTFDSNGGSPVPAATLANGGIYESTWGLLVRRPETPSKPGHVFVDWFTAPDFNARRWNFEGRQSPTGVPLMRPTADVTIYAMWAPVDSYEWSTTYVEDFTTPVDDSLVPWYIDDYSNMSHPVWGNNAIGFYDRETKMRNGYNGTNATGTSNNHPITGTRGVDNGHSFADRMAAFNEFRKDVFFGEDDWLVIRQYGINRDLTATEPATAGRFEIAGDGKATFMNDRSYDAAIITNAEPLPPAYRVSITLTNIDAGGINIDPVTGREIPLVTNNATNRAWIVQREWNGMMVDWINGMPPGAHMIPEGYPGREDVLEGNSGSHWRPAGPWGLNENQNTQGNASSNGMYFLAVNDYSVPQPNNNLFIHHRRKLAIDSNSHESGFWSDVWNPAEERHVPDGSRYISMLWQNGIARNNPYPLAPTAGTQQWPEWSQTNWVRWNAATCTYNEYMQWFRNGTIFYSYTATGHHASTANRMFDKYMPNTEYTFTVERTPEYYKQIAEGEFFFGGVRVYEHTKFHLPEKDPTNPRFNFGVPTWHFNQSFEELMGWTPPNITLTLDGGDNWWGEEQTFVFNTWPLDETYPDHFFFGIPHVQYYVGTTDFLKVVFETGTKIDQPTYNLATSATPNAGGRVVGTPGMQPFNGLPYEYAEGAFISLTAIPNTGLRFVEWEMTGIDTLDTAKSVLQFDLPAGNVNAVARFVAADNLIIAYNANGGAGAVSAGTVLPGEDYVIEENAFYFTDYVFVGWNTEADGSGDAYAPGDVMEDINADITLFAQWVHYTEFLVRSAIPSAFVTQLQGNTNNLTITVVETLNNGMVTVYMETISIRNNAEGTYVVGPYKVFVDTKGNTQIRAIYIVN